MKHVGETHVLRAIGCVVALSAVGCDAPAGAPDWAGSVLPEPLEKPDFVLTDTEGKRYDFLTETRGKVALLFFGYTNCPDICPVHLANIAAVLRDMPYELTRHVEVVFVTTDPDRDTPERLGSWLDAMGWPIVGLRGTREEVNALETELLSPRSYVQEADDGTIVVAHSARVIAFGGDGPARVTFPWGTRQEDWRRDLPRLVRETVPDAGD